jgi:hypothetical protein
VADDVRGDILEAKRCDELRKVGSDVWLCWPNRIHGRLQSDTKRVRTRRNRQAVRWINLWATSYYEGICLPASSMPTNQPSSVTTKLNSIIITPTTAAFSRFPSSTNRS